MASVQTIPSGYLTKMNFYYPLDEFKDQKPYYSTIPFSSPGAPPQTKYGSIEKEIRVVDIRVLEDEFSLDKTGFELVKFPTRFSSWRDGMQVKQSHYLEVEEFLKEKLGADRVIVFDHSLRRTGITNDNAQPGEEYSAPPSTRPHVDHTLASAINQVKLELGADAEQIFSQGRCQLLTVWRPLFGPIQDHPLAMCDSRTVDQNDLVAVDLVFPHYVSELYKIYYNESQKWYYVHHQMPDEVWLMKMCDSRGSDTIAPYCPHASFIHPEAPPDARLRESIEIRVLIFHDTWE